MIENPYKKVQHFHEVFDKQLKATPTAFTPEEASFRSGFMAEELVEFLYAAAENDGEVFQQLVGQLKQAVDQAVEKIAQKKQPTQDVLVEEVDALMDMLYFTYGSFVLCGTDPTKIFEIVHAANMGKLFPDGTAHYDEITHKILKPADWEERFAPEQKIKAELTRQRENCDRN